MRALIPRTNLQQLCAPIIEHRTVLPQRQRDALESVFGLGDAPAPDRFLVGLAVIGLLDAAAQDRAVLCIVDDVQWLDDLSAQTLFFIARRLLAEPVGLLFAVREPVDGMAGLPQLPIQGLAAADARALLESTFPGLLDKAVGDRIVSETRGNPLALLEIPNHLTAAEQAIGYRPPGPRPVAGEIERHYQRVLQTLPGDTQHVLLLAAAEPVGDVALLTRAQSHLRLPVTAFGPLTGVQHEHDGGVLGEDD